MQRIEKDYQGYKYEIREEGLYDMEKNLHLAGSESFSTGELEELFARAEENEEFLERECYAYPPLYSFEYDDSDIGIPFYEDTCRFNVNPFEYYGVENIKEFVTVARQDCSVD